MKNHFMRYVKTLLTVLVMMGLLACDELYEAPEDMYVIKKGAHKSQINGSILGNNVRSLKSHTLKFTVRFDSSAAYDLGSKDQDDVNKLFGFSDCNSFHHKNSVRIGWSYHLESKKVVLHAYVYRNSKRVIKKIREVNIGSTYVCQISLNGPDYVISVGNTEAVQIPRGDTCDRGLYYLLYPYFGGNQPAPHDINIYLKELFE